MKRIGKQCENGDRQQRYPEHEDKDNGVTWGTAIFRNSQTEDVAWWDMLCMNYGLRRHLTFPV